MNRFHFSRTFVLALCLAPTCSAENYPQFRGANGDAIVDSDLPVTWSDVDEVQKNVRWKIALEGEGWSQPIVSKNSVCVLTSGQLHPPTFSIHAGTGPFR